MSNELPIPADLGSHGKELWQNITSIWCFENEPDNIAVLEMVCRSWQRYQDCERQIREVGLVTTNRYGKLVPNPLIDVQRRAHAQILAGLRQIGVEYEIETAPRRRPGRPPKGK